MGAALSTYASIKNWAIRCVSAAWVEISVSFMKDAKLKQKGDKTRPARDKPGRMLAVWQGAHLKYTYTNAHRMSNKWKELEAVVQHAN